VPGAQPNQIESQAPCRFKQRGNGYVRFAHCKRNAASLLPHLQHGRQTTEIRVRYGRAIGQRKLDNMCTAQAGNKLGRRTQCDHFPMIDHGDATAQSFCFIHVVCREERRLASLAESANRIP